MSRGQPDLWSKKFVFRGANAASVVFREGKITELCGYESMPLSSAACYLSRATQRLLKKVPFKSYSRRVRAAERIAIQCILLNAQ